MITFIGWLQQFQISRVLPTGKGLGSIIRIVSILLFIHFVASNLKHIKKRNDANYWLSIYGKIKTRTINVKKSNMISRIILFVIAGLFIASPLLGINDGIQPKFRIASDSIGQLTSANYFIENHGLANLKNKIELELQNANPKYWFDKEYFLKSKTEKTIFSTSSLTTQIQGNWLIGSDRTALPYFISVLRTFSIQLNPIETQILYLVLFFGFFAITLSSLFMNQKVLSMSIFTCFLALGLMNLNFLQVSQEGGFGILFVLPFIGKILVSTLNAKFKLAFLEYALLIALSIMLYQEIIIFTFPLLLFVLTRCIENGNFAKITQSKIFIATSFCFFILIVYSKELLKQIPKDIYPERVQDLEFGGFSAISAVPNFLNWLGLYNYIHPDGVFERSKIEYIYPKESFLLYALIIIFFIVCFFQRRISSMLLLSSSYIIFNLLQVISITYSNPYPLWKYAFLGNTYLLFFLFTIAYDFKISKNYRHIRSSKVSFIFKDSLHLSIIFLVFVLFLQSGVSTLSWQRDFEKNAKISPFYQLSRLEMKNLIQIVENRDLSFQGIWNPVILGTFTDFYWSERGRNLGAIPAQLPISVAAKEYLVESYVHQQDPRNDCLTKFGPGDITPLPFVVYSEYVCITKLLVRK